MQGGLLLTRREKIKAINKETCVVLLLYAIFFAWWYLTAYGLGGGDPAEYKFVFGFPAWFFYSCIVGYIGISLLLWIVIKLFFKDIPFDEEEENDA
ncbi:YhdT family protein [Synergistaceae bacterium OttesenSCG-928-D05]|nr:YhdT family protein [Synergistaceae bacterium OttesenSCG-928-D05]